MENETDYKFQHEESEVLEDAAVTAVKKTEWLEYYQYRRQNAAYSGLMASIYVIRFIYGSLHLPEPHGLIGGASYLLFVFGVAAAYLISIIRLSATYSGLKRRRYLMTRWEKIEYAGIFLLSVLVLFTGFGTFNERLSMAFCIGIVLFTLRECCEVLRTKKKLINWGVLQLDKPPIDEEQHIAIQLQQTEAIVDNTLGVPKRKLFRKATVMAK